MKYCAQCGEELVDGSRFCSSCGAPVGEGSSKSENGTVKCPQCGEPIEPFSGYCAACGHEFRNLAASDAVRELDQRVRSASSESERAKLIQLFPVPNSREDLLEFLALASSALNNLCAGQELDAWRFKYEQCYQKAKLSFDSKDLARFEELRQDTAKKMQMEEVERGKRKSIQTLMHPLVLAVAILLVAHEVIWLAEGNGFGLLNIILDSIILWAAIKASIKLENLRK